MFSRDNLRGRTIVLCIQMSQQAEDVMRAMYEEATWSDSRAFSRGGANESSFLEDVVAGSR